jgi:GntR family transcriptional regulator/MocR family aminotransferase
MTSPALTRRASFALDRDSGEPLYRQLRAAIERGITDGAIDIDAPLPSSRQLADDLGLSRNTVNAAYQELIAAGVVDSRPRSGLFVAAQPAPRKAVPAGMQFDWSRRLGVVRTMAVAREQPRVQYPFVTGRGDGAGFPARAWARAVREAVLPPHDRDTLGVVPEDDPMLVDMICRHVLPARGIHVRPEQVLVTASPAHARSLLTTTLARPGTTVALADPGPAHLRTVLTARGADLVAVPVDEDGMVVPDDLRGADLLVVTPTHQVPTGVTMSGTRRRELLDRARAAGTVVIEVDADSDLRYEGSPAPALYALDDTGLVVHVGSFATVLAPALTLGYVVGAPELIDALRARRRVDPSPLPAHVQRAMALLIDAGDYARAVHEHRRRLRTRWSVLREQVARHLPVGYTPTTGGRALWLTGPADLDSRRLGDLARQRGIGIEPGGRFFAEPAHHHLRLGFAHIEARHIESGVRRLAALVPLARTAGRSDVA